MKKADCLDLIQKQQQLLKNQDFSLLPEDYLSELVTTIITSNKYRPYNQLPEKVLFEFKKIKTRSGPKNLTNLKKQLFLELMKTAILGRVNLPLTDELKSLQLDEFKRIIEEMSTNEENFYLDDGDLFLKDFALCSQKMIFAKAQLLELYVKKSPKMFLYGKPLTKIKNILKFIGEFRGRGPYLEIHTSEKHLNHFNEIGWRETYRLASELMKLNPDIKGIIGASWFYDPSLENISPRLCYLRKEPMDGGAYFIELYHDDDSADLATRTSPTRKQLYQDGKYLPKKYMLIWESHKMAKYGSLCEKKN